MIDKKKIKEDFKNFVPPKGVFILRNEVTGKVFLGSSLNLKNKEVRIRLQLSTGNHYIKELQLDWNKYGENAFKYEELETLELKDDLNYNYSDDLEFLEMIWIDKYKPFEEKCYNKNEKIRIV